MDQTVLSPKYQAIVSSKASRAALLVGFTYQALTSLILHACDVKSVSDQEDKPHSQNVARLTDEAVPNSDQEGGCNQVPSEAAFADAHHHQQHPVGCDRDVADHPISDSCQVERTTEALVIDLEVIRQATRGHQRNILRAEISSALLPHGISLPACNAMVRRPSMFRLCVEHRPNTVHCVIVEGNMPESIHRPAPLHAEWHVDPGYVAGPQVMETPMTSACNGTGDLCITVDGHQICHVQFDEGNCTSLRAKWRKRPMHNTLLGYSSSS